MFKSYYRECLLTLFLDFKIYNIFKSFSIFLKKSKVWDATPSKLPPLKSPAKGFLEVLYIIIFLLIFSNCGFIKNEITLKEQDVLNYISVYKVLRTQAPEILKSINTGPESNISEREGFQLFLKIIQKGGFKNYENFVWTNAKIGAIISLLQAESGMDRFNSLNTESMSSIDQGIKELEKVLSDPNLSDETRMDIHHTLVELQESRRKLMAEWEKNKPYADWILDKAKSISGLILNESEIWLVKKYESEIIEAYLGFPLPKVSNGKMPDLRL